MENEGVKIDLDGKIDTAVNENNSLRQRYISSAISSPGGLLNSHKLCVCMLVWWVGYLVEN